VKDSERRESGRPRRAGTAQKPGPRFARPGGQTRFFRWILPLLVVVSTARAGDPVDARSLRGKVLCGYQGWFRCPGDAMNAGWIHWSRDAKRITPATLTFEMWPDLADFPDRERYDAPGFTDAAGRTMQLFSSDDASTVLRHFGWMRDHGIDGVWLQHFVVDLPGGPAEKRYESRMRVLHHVRTAAQRTGRAWALAYDISAMPVERLFDTLTRDWKKLVDDGVTGDARYIHEGGRPAVEVWGFYLLNHETALTPSVANRIIDFFKAPGPYSAFLIGGGDWDWRRNSDPEWRRLLRRLDGYSPWNIGNFTRDAAGVQRAVTGYWAEDKAECERNGMLWLPVVYPGFSWDNLKGKPPGTSAIPRRGGKFLWEQFRELSRLGAGSVCVAMFDEVDEGTAIFKVSNTPPLQGHFVTYEGLPSDWYLRLVGEATRLLRAGRPVPEEIPLRP